MTNFLLYEQDGPVVTLTMNQPEVRNALTGNTAVDEFVAACERIRADMSVRAVILTAAGSVFSSGGNVKDMRRFCGDEMSPVRNAGFSLSARISFSSVRIARADCWRFAGSFASDLRITSSSSGSMSFSNCEGGGGGCWA